MAASRFSPPRLGFLPALTVLSLPSVLFLLFGCAGRSADPGREVRADGEASAKEAQGAGQRGEAGAPAEETADSDSAAAAIRSAGDPGLTAAGGDSTARDSAGLAPQPDSGRGSDVSLVKVAPDGGPADGEPLIMENADAFEGTRSRGEFVLTGNVRFRHGDLRFSTERAVWDRERNLLRCDSGLRIEHRGALLTGRTGRYDKQAGKAMAEGDVFLRDSSGTLEAGGGRMVYHRRDRVAALSGDPYARRLYPAGDSSGGSDDTLTIRAQVLKVNDSTGVADAEREVTIVREDLRITCGAARLLTRQDSLILRREPKLRLDDNEIEGDSMRVALKGDAVRGLLVLGDAEALALEPATDSTPARHSRVSGDSLVMALREGALDSVEVFRNAKGATYEKGRTDQENRMEGRSMVLRFHERRVQGAEVRGEAKSLYYHFEEGRLKGRNEARGDTIHFRFHEGKIDEVLVLGSASGTYFGLGQAAAEPDSSGGAP